MQASIKAVLFGVMLAMNLPSQAAGKPPADGTTTCKWVGDEKVCTTVHQKAKTYDNGFLRPEQVKQCLLDKRRITADSAQFNTDRSAYNAEGNGINADSAAIQKSAEELQANGKKLSALRSEIEQLAKDIQDSNPALGQASRLSSNDPAKKATAYNKRVAEYTEEQSAYNAKISAYNGTVSAQKERIVKHATADSAFTDREKALRDFADGVHARCVEGRQVYEDDLKAAEDAIAREDAAKKQ